MYSTTEQRINALIRFRQKREIKRELRQKQKEIKIAKRDRNQYKFWAEKYKDDLDKIMDRIQSISSMTVLLDPQTYPVKHLAKLTRIHIKRSISFFNIHESERIVPPNLDVAMRQLNLLEVHMQEVPDSLLGTALHFYVQTPDNQIALKFTKEAWNYYKTNPKELSERLAEMFMYEITKKTW